jgi:hypothetical protein
MLTDIFSVLLLSNGSEEFSYKDDFVYVRMTVRPAVMGRFYLWTHVTCLNKFSCGCNKLPIDAKTGSDVIKKQVVEVSNQVLTAGYRHSALQLLRAL